MLLGKLVRDPRSLNTSYDAIGTNCNYWYFWWCWCVHLHHWVDPCPVWACGSSLDFVHQVRDDTFLAWTSVRFTDFPLCGSFALTGVQGKVERRTLELADERMSILTQIVETVKAIKFFAWEPEYLDRITSVRTQECRKIREERMLHVTSVALGRTSRTSSHAHRAASQSLTFKFCRM